MELDLRPGDIRKQRGDQQKGTKVTKKEWEVADRGVGGS
jgi:hypothetical protein